MTRKAETYLAYPQAWSSRSPRDLRSPLSVGVWPFIRILITRPSIPVAAGAFLSRLLDLRQVVELMLFLSTSSDGVSFHGRLSIFGIREKGMTKNSIGIPASGLLGPLVDSEYLLSFATHDETLKQDTCFPLWRI